MKYPSFLTINLIFSQLLIPRKLGFALSGVQVYLLVCVICSTLLKGSAQTVVSTAPGCQDAQPSCKEKAHKWRSVRERWTVINTKRPSFTGKWEKGRECELAKFKFRCLPFYTAILEVESKAKCRTYPALSCRVKGPQNFSVVLSPPTWLTFSAGKRCSLCWRNW